MRVRDEAVRLWPPTHNVRTNPVPPWVLQALGLSKPVIGIDRFPPRSIYRVGYIDGNGQKRTRHFYFRVVPEEVAYAAAIDFLQSQQQKD